MSGSRRIPIERPRRVVIDAEAVKMFRRCVRLMDAGLEDEKEFRNLSVALHRRLNLKVWQESVLFVDDDPPDDPHHIKDWKLVTALRHQLLAAAFGGGEGQQRRQVVSEELPESLPTFHHGASKPWKTESVSVGSVTDTLADVGVDASLAKRARGLP